MWRKQTFIKNLTIKVSDDLPVEGYMGGSIVTCVSIAEEVVTLIKLVTLLQLVSLSDEKIGGWREHLSLR